MFFGSTKIQFPSILAKLDFLVFLELRRHPPTLLYDENYSVGNRFETHWPIQVACIHSSALHSRWTIIMQTPLHVPFTWPLLSSLAFCIRLLPIVLISHTNSLHRLNWNCAPFNCFPPVQCHPQNALDKYVSSAIHGYHLLTSVHTRPGYAFPIEKSGLHFPVFWFIGWHFSWTHVPWERKW